MRRLLVMVVLALVAAFGPPIAGLTGSAHAADATYTFSGTVGYGAPAVYSVPLVAGDAVVARLTCDPVSGGGRPLDPYLYVLDHSGLWVAMSDDGFPPNCDGYSSSCVEFTATETADYSFNAALASGQPGPYTLSIYVNDPAVVCAARVTSPTTVDALVGEPFSYTATVTGIDGPVTPRYTSVDGGSVDIPGLTADGAVLSGTPTVAGQYLVSVIGEGGPAFGSVLVTVRDKPAFTSSTTDTATYGQFMGYTFTASGFPEPEVTIDRSTLPAGFYITHSDTFEGVPEETGTFTISATASNGTTDVSRQLTLTINKAQFSAAPAPVITGVAKVGETLGVDVGTVAPAPDAWSYQWLVNGMPIADATEATYVPRAADTDKAISVEVTASRAHYVDATTTSGAVGPVATDQAPDVSFRADRTALRRGASTTLRWSTTHADTVTARGEWNGPRAVTGRQIVKPTRIGNNVYRLEATNDNGTSVAQVVIGVRLPAAHLAVAAPRHAVAGRPLPVAARGLDPREPYRIVVGGTVVATGKANAAGKVARRVQMPARAGRKAVRVIGAEADRTGSDAVQVRRKLAAHVAHDRIRASDRQQVKVRNLLPRQRVVVVAAGHKVGVARANRRGVATVGFKVGQIWGTVEVMARAGGQRASTSYRIVERCPGARYVCP